MNGVVLHYTLIISRFTEPVAKGAFQIIETYKITNRTFWIGIIHFNTKKQASTEKLLRKTHFDVAEGTQIWGKLKSPHKMIP